MAYSIDYDEQTGIMLVTHTGVVTLESRLKLLEAGKKVAPEGKPVKVLSDLRNAELRMTSEELIQYGEIAASDPRSRGSRVATVYRSDTPEKYLGETMFHLQGNDVKVASFTSMDEAYQWLNKV